MQIQTILLDLFASLALISAMIVITSTNPIHSVVFLILVFCNAAGLLVLLRTEFIAMMFLIIYVGAIAVLFLFVVMMLNIKVAEGGNEPAPGDVPEGMFQKRSWPLGGIVGAILFLEMAPFLFQIVPWASPPGGDLAERPTAKGHALVEQGLGETTRIAARFSEGRLPPLPGGSGQRSWPSLIDSLTNIQSLGYLIYTYYFYYFLMAGMVLLTAMIGAIVLTMHKRKNASSKKKQLIFKQIARNFENSVAYGALPNGRAPLLDVCERGGGH